MCVEQRMPVTVAHLRGPPRRVHDVGEQHRGENPIIGHVCLLAGEELSDLLEGLRLRFHEVVHVAARQLNVFRARYVISDVLAPSGGINGSSACWRTRVGTRIVGSTARTSISAQRHHESDGPWARRQAFHSCPRCPDLLVPWHVRIEHMLGLPRAPHGDHGGDDFLADRPVGAFSHRIRVTLQHDQRGGAGRMCRREQRPCRERAGVREEDRFTTPEIVEHRGDAVGPLLQGRQRARPDGIGAPVPGWSKKISRPSDVIASTHP